MRYLLCKIHCPSFICFCKPPHIYSQRPLNLENSPHVPSRIVSERIGENLDEKQQQEEDGGEGENCLKSSLRKVASEPKGDQKKRVQWMDFIGKELVEIREFESGELEETDNGEDNRSCVCIIV